MVDWNTYTDDFLLRHFGVMTQRWGGAYPDITAALGKLYRTKMAGITWIPNDWMQSIQYLNGKDGRVIIVVPSTATPRATFLDTPEKRAVWDELAYQLNQVQQAMVNGERERGAALVAAAENNAAFWEKAYQVGRVLALPVTGLQAMWNNPWLTGTVVYGGLALLLFLRFRPRRSKD